MKNLKTEPFLTRNYEPDVRMKTVKAAPLCLENSGAENSEASILNDWRTLKMNPS